MNKNKDELLNVFYFILHSQGERVGWESTWSEREENYLHPKPKGLKYETSDRGLSLLEGYLLVK